MSCVLGSRDDLRLGGRQYGHWYWSLLLPTSRRASRLAVARVAHSRGERARYPSHPRARNTTINPNFAFFPLFFLTIRIPIPDCNLQPPRLVAVAKLCQRDDKRAPRRIQRFHDVLEYEAGIIERMSA